MKLRIKGNSVRLRLGQSEVIGLVQRGYLEDRTEFGDGDLVYRLEMSEEVTVVTASFQKGQIYVTVPRETAVNWAVGDAVGIDGIQALADGELKILIEKDFECLNPAHGDQADAFPHPLSGTACTGDPLA